MTADDRKKISKYFKKFPKWVLWALLPCLVLLFVEPISGIIGIGLGIFFIRKWYVRISDRQFDTYLEESLQTLEEQAKDKLRLDDADLVKDTESVLSPVFWRISGAEFGLKKGNDRAIRYTPVCVALIFFTEHKLCIYQCSLDLTTGNPLNVGSKKYFYEDVVSIETESNTITIDRNDIKKEVFRHLPKLNDSIVNNKLQINQSEQFVLTTRGGNSIKIQLPDYTILNYGVDGELVSSRSDQAIASVEAMLDSKKSKSKNVTTKI
ncbi:MAG: hypothetical protein JXR03_21010 [Cyclobacteriaceae bacterium]